jgi:hypothetical protein
MTPYHGWGVLCVRKMLLGKYVDRQPRGAECENSIWHNPGTRLSANRMKRLRQAEVDALCPNAEQALAVSSPLLVLHGLAEQLRTVATRVQSRSHRPPP